MKGLLWLLAAFALAAGLSVVMHENKGEVVLLYAPWRIDLSLNLLLILLLAGFAGVYFLIRVFAHTLGLPAYVRAYRVRRRETRASEAIEQSLQALYEGSHVRASKYATRAYDLGSTRALAAIVAASAAQRLRDFSLRDTWIARARSAEPNWRRAALAAEADLLLGERRYDAARSVLIELQAGNARDPATLAALLRAEQGLKNWGEVVRIARLIEKAGSMPREALEGIVINAHIAMLSREDLDVRAVADYWRSVPAAEQRETRVAVAAARAWAQVGDERNARLAIENSLGAAWEREPVLLYGECGAEEASVRVEHAEGWLKEHEHDAALLLALGHLCGKRGLWGKARSYFEASLALDPARETHMALAGYCDQIGLVDEANNHYRAAAQAAGRAG